MRLRVLVLLGIAFSSARAQAPARWNVDSARGPETVLDYVASQGTWMSVDVSPDGRFIAFDLLGHIYEMPAAGGRAKALTSGRSWNMFPRYSPDGARIAFTSDRSGTNALWVMRRGGDSLTQVSKLDKPTFQGSWSRDGRFLYGTSLDMGARTALEQFGFFGTHQELATSNFGVPVSHAAITPSGDAIYFGRGGGDVYQGPGFKIDRYDAKTGTVAVAIERSSGGAADPTISHDGKQLAFIHRDDQQTVLVVHDLETGAERVVSRALDRDRQEAGPGVQYGAHPNVSWTPNDQEIVLTYGGRIHAVNVATGAARDIPFEAPVHRDITKAQRVAVPLPEGKARTRAHRWTQRADRGLLFEALGDLYLKDGERLTNLTRSAALESNPLYDAGSKTVFYTSWTDDSSGGVWAMPIAGGAPRRLSTMRTQYGALSLSPDGRTLAALRGAAEGRGKKLQDQTEYEVVLLATTGASSERVATRVKWRAGAVPPFVATVDFDARGDRLYVSEMIDGDTLVVRRMRLDGSDREVLATLPHATSARISPDGRWLAFREYARGYVAPLEYVGKSQRLSGFDKIGVTKRIDALDGEDVIWSRDAATLAWTRGATFHEKPLATIVADGGDKVKSAATDLSFEFDVDAPSLTLALTNARVLTMNGRRDVIERATIIVRNGRIEAIGANVAVPSGAKVYDLAGRTIMPGIIDAHAHYDQSMSPLGVVEQSPVGLLANLAAGVTTMYEVYGNAHKDFLLSDLQRRGSVDGARLLSTGAPVYGLRYFRPKTYRPITSYDDAYEVVKYNKDHGATALKDYVEYGRAQRQQLIAAARALDMNVVAETAIDPQMNMTQLVDGFSGLEHTPGLEPMYEDVAKLFAASGTGMTPTLIVVYNSWYGEQHFWETERLWEDPRLVRFHPRDDLMRYRRPPHHFDDDLYATRMARALKILHDAGVSLQVGGHGEMVGRDSHWEMELFVQGGFTPMDAMQFATINGARYLGLDKQLGSIETGKLADLVILSKNPLENIRNARDVEMVVQNGNVFSGEDARRLWPEARPAKRLYFMDR